MLPILYIKRAEFNTDIRGHKCLTKEAQIKLTVGTKCDKYYYKILTILLQRATGTTLLQSATIIKVRQIKAYRKKKKQRAYGPAKFQK